MQTALPSPSCMAKWQRLFPGLFKSSPELRQLISVIERLHDGTDPPWYANIRDVRLSNYLRYRLEYVSTLSTNHEAEIRQLFQLASKLPLTKRRVLLMSRPRCTEDLVAEAEAVRSQFKTRPWARLPEYKCKNLPFREQKIRRSKFKQPPTKIQASSFYDSRIKPLERSYADTQINEQQFSRMFNQYRQRQSCFPIVAEAAPSLHQSLPPPGKNLSFDSLILSIGYDVDETHPRRNFLHHSQNQDPGVGRFVREDILKLKQLKRQKVQHRLKRVSRLQRQGSPPRHGHSPMARGRRSRDQQ